MTLVSALTRCKIPEGETAKIALHLIITNELKLRIFIQNEAEKQR